MVYYLINKIVLMLLKYIVNVIDVQLIYKYKPSHKYFITQSFAILKKLIN